MFIFDVELEYRSGSYLLIIYNKIIKDSVWNQC